jgi:hypothetical protein
MNATVFQDFRRIWTVTTLQRGERRMLVLGWLALAGGALAGVGAFLAVLAHKQGPLFLLQILAGFLAFWLGFVWMSLFVPASILLNSPANARLVPRQRRRLMQMAAAGWLLVCAGISFASWEWAVFPAVGLGLIGYAMLCAGKRWAGLLFVVVLNWGSLSRHVLPPAVVEAVGSDAGLWILSVLMLPAGAWALRTLYPAAGDAHLARRGGQLARGAQPKRPDINSLGPLARLGWAASTRLYGRMLQRDQRRPRPGRMLMHALGPMTHWSARIGSMAGILIVGFGVRLLLLWRGEGMLHESVRVIMAACVSAMTIVILFSTAAFSQQIRKTAGEQSLLRLTPLAGSAPLLNRRLALELLKSALRHWAMLTGAILVTVCLIGGPGEMVAAEAAMCLLAAQVAIMGLLGDFAAEGSGWTVPRAVQAGFLGFFELFVAMGLARLGLASTWTWLALIAIGAGAFQLQRAWRVMLAAPPAFPAGRMG